jgi:hypothetical protein
MLQEVADLFLKQFVLLDMVKLICRGKARVFCILAASNPIPMPAKSPHAARIGATEETNP